MGERESSTSTFKDLLGPGVITLLVAVIALLTHQPQLLSRRTPVREEMPGPPSPKGLEAARARLWEDPLAVAYRHASSNRSTISPLDRLVLRLLPGRPDDPVTPIAEYIHNVVEQSTRSGGAFYCLPVLLPGGNQSDDVEQRLRISYAVHAALAASGFQFGFPDRLTYIEVPVWADLLRVDSGKEVLLTVPIRLFENADPADRKTVIVCWINEGQCGDRPLTAIGQVLEGMFQPADRENVNLRIIGPTSSDTLLKIAKEDAGWQENRKQPTAPAAPSAQQRFNDVSSGTFAKYKGSTLFSPRATVASDKRLADLVSAKAKHPSGLERIVKTIGTDKDLVLEIVSELERRAAWPFVARSDTRRSIDFDTPPGDCLVLVTERDTLYGRTWRTLFEDEMKDKRQLKVVTYLRGIDGQEGGDRSDRERTESKDRAPFDPQTILNDAEELPAAGRSQFDYLRRLEATLVELHEEMRSKRLGKGIRAIGVLGTDVYDKLLILRALRKRFPNTWFFTTDLDAELARRSELPTTRNLLVASHYALELHPDLQRDATPFRDSYQTATFLAGLRAIEDRELKKVWPATDAGHPLWSSWESAADKPLTPLVFEIGRNGPYQLSITGSSRRVTPSNATIHPESPRESPWLTWWRLIALLVAAGILAIIGRAFRDGTLGPILALLEELRKSWRTPWKPLAAATRESRASAVMIGSGLTLVALLSIVAWFDHQRPDGEPFSLNAGISLWPTTILRSLAGVIAMAFGVKAWRGLERSNELAIDPQSAEATYGLYVSDTERAQRCRFVLAVTTLYVIASVFLFWSTDWPTMPFRGRVSQYSGHLALMFVIVCYMLLTIYVIDATLLCNRYVGRIADKPAAWSPEVRRRHHCGDVEEAVASASTAADDRMMNELCTIRVVVDVTKRVGRMIAYPFYVLCVMIVSRASFFDSLNLPAILLLLWGATFVAVVYLAYDLGRKAEDGRNRVLDRLDGRLLAESKPDRVEKLKLVLTEIRGERDGAFRPFVQSPLFLAISIPLGGTSGLLLLEYFVLGS